MAAFAPANAVDADDLERRATGCIYHEKQYGSMCGQHCLNNLLQAPYFQPDDLATIAHELDKAEKELCGDESTGHGSNNVDDAGNFSIQVLATALKRSHSLSLVQDTRVLTEILDELSREDASLEGSDVAFVCNLANHWFAIRSIRGEVYNLNSLKKRPERISLFYLSAYLGQLREEGYSIFVVRGDLPVPLQDFNIGRRQDWYVLGVDDVNVEPDPQRVSLHTQDPDEDAQLQAALRASMRSAGSSGVLEEDFGDGDDSDLQAALALSMQASRSATASAGGDIDDEDDELRRALQLSTQHE